MSELAAVLAERLQHVEASAAMFQSETPPDKEQISKGSAFDSPLTDESSSPLRLKHGFNEEPLRRVSTPLQGRVRRRSLIIEDAIQQQRSLPSRLNSAALRFYPSSCSDDSESKLAELCSLRAGFCSSLAAISVQDFTAQSADWLSLVEGCCKNADSRVAEQGWHLLLEVFRCKRLCEHFLAWSPDNLEASLGCILQKALCVEAAEHVSDAVELLMTLAVLWPNDADSDVASRVLLANDAALLESVAELSVSLLAEAHTSTEGSTLLRLLAHVGEGGIVQQKLAEKACAGAVHAARVLAEAHICEITLLAAGELALLGAQSACAQATEDAAAVLRELLEHAKCGNEFAGIDSRIKCIRTIRALADILLCNGHAMQSLHERVASLGIPSKEVSTNDVSVLWWILQLNPKALGVNVQTVDSGRSKRLIEMCVNSGLIDRLSKICSGTISVAGDGLGRYYSLALLIHFARVSEDIASKVNLDQCFEEGGSWSTRDLFNVAPPIMCSGVDTVIPNADFKFTVAAQGGSDDPQTMIWMALRVWLPCNREGTRAWVVKRTFPVIAATLMRLLIQRKSSQNPWDAAPYTDYLLRWYISTGGEFVTVAGFFHLICTLVSLPDANTASASKGPPESGLFLEAVAVALDRFNAACHVPPPSRMLEKALADTKCLMAGAPCRASSRIIAQFFSSALCCHRPNVHADCSNVSPCYAFLVSKVLPEIWDAVGDKCAEHIRRLVESGAAKISVCQAIEKRLLPAPPARGGA